MFSLRSFFSREERREHGGEGVPRLRPLLASDLDVVMRIERESHPSAWPREALVAWLAQPGVSGHVLEDERGVCAFFLVGRAPRCLRVLNLAVAADRRRRGLGRTAMAIVEELARAERLPAVELEVRESNLPAQVLYRQCGYKAHAILRGHYGDEDGYAMRLDLE